MSQKTTLWTKTLTSGSLAIDASMGVTILSCLLSSGAASVAGTAQIGDYPSEAVDLVSGTPLTLYAKPGSFLDGITFQINGTVTFVALK